MREQSSLQKDAFGSQSKLDKMKNIEEIMQILHDEKNSLSEKYPIENIAIFGSYARNEQNPNSDIDILVEFNDKIGIKFIDFGDELSELLDLKVDLISKQGLKPKYFEAISRDLQYI